MANKKVVIDPAKMKVMIFKWQRKELLDEGFIAFPKRLLRCLRQVLEGTKPLTDLRVILAIVDLRRPDDDKPFSISHLASIAGIPPKVFLERLNDLATRRLLKIEFSPDDPNRVRVDISRLAKRILIESDPEEDDDDEAY